MHLNRSVRSRAAGETALNRGVLIDAMLLCIAAVASGSSIDEMQCMANICEVGMGNILIRMEGNHKCSGCISFSWVVVYSTTITRDGFEDGGWRCQALVSLRQLRWFRASCFRDCPLNLKCKSQSCLCVHVSFNQPVSPALLLRNGPVCLESTYGSSTAVSPCVVWHA